MQYNLSIDVDPLKAFEILCKELSMSFVLNEEIDYFVKDGKVWYNEYGYDEVVDDRADLFIALRNVAVNFIPNLLFRNADYIYKSEEND